MLLRGFNSKLNNTRNFSQTVILFKDERCPVKATQNAESKLPDDWDTAIPYEDMPGPKPLPLIGNAWRFLVGDFKITKDFVVMHNALRKKYGDIYALRKIASIGDFIFVYDPNEIEKMYRNEGIWPVREGFFSLSYYRNVMRKHIFGETGSLVSARGEDWYKLRSAVNPILMHPRTPDQYVNVINNVAEDFIKRVEVLKAKNNEGEMPVDFANEINKYTFESIGVIALDRRLGCLDVNPNLEAQKMIKYMVEMFDMLFILDFTPLGPLYRNINAPLWRRFVKYQDFFTNMALKYINEAEEKIKADPNYHKKLDTDKSAFEQILQKDKWMAVVMTLDMLAAGIDTTGKLSSAILYYLAKNPEVQTKLRKELLTLLPGKNDPMTKEILENAKYLKAVVKETNRMAPIGAANARVSTKEMTLGGYQIPKGVTILAPTLYLSLIDKYYVKPKEFIPERWLRTTTGELSQKNVHPFITLPFGFGPRSCIGRRLATLEIETLIAKMIRNYVLEWPHPNMKFGQKILYGIQEPLKLHLKTFPQ